MSAKVHDPITPGEILLTEFLEPLGISQYRLARATGLPQTRISEIVHGRRRITPDTGLRLSRALGLSERYWINMQTDYDIEAEHDLHEEDCARSRCWSRGQASPARRLLRAAGEVPRELLQSGAAL